MTGCGDDDSRLLRSGLGQTARELAVAGFAALWHHRRATPSELLPADAAAATDCAAALVDLGRAELDTDGYLVGIHGLTLRSTRHRIEHDTREHHTWCAFDAIGIPAALGINAYAHTDCPTCGEHLAIELTNGAPATIGPVLWLPAPPTENLLTEFCASADLFCSTEHLHQRVDTHKLSGRMCSLDAAVALGVQTWDDVATTAGRQRRTTLE